MRHRVSKKKLSRTTGHRKALIRNLSSSLILNGKMETTLAKAKFVQPYVEKLVTKAKKVETSHQIDKLDSKLNSASATRTLIEEIAPKMKDRAGGYTRLTKTGFRAGDKAPMATLEWVEASKTSTTKKAEPKKAKSDEKVEEKEE